MRKRRTVRAGGLGALSAALVAGLLVLAPTSTGASAIDTGYQLTPPVTWVDPQGRQHVVTAIMLDASPPSGTFVLVDARDTAEGEPDPAWGTWDDPREGKPDQVGVKQIDPAPPTEGLKREPILSFDPAGVLTATFVNSACATSTSRCDRWFTHLLPDGTSTGIAVQRETTARPVRPLPDGSFLAVDPSNGKLAWLAPDGIDRGAPDLALDQVDRATVDRQGRLLLTTKGRHVLRKPAGGAVDLDLDLSTSCFGNSAQVAVAPATTDDGFATVCGVAASGVTVQRRDAAGAVLWNASGASAVDPRGRLERTTAGVIDDAGTVWIGGSGEEVPDDSPHHLALVQTFTAEGPGNVEYVRSSPAFGFFYEYDSEMIHEVRAIGGGRVAIADELGCCDPPSGGPSPDSQAFGLTLPRPPAAPTCTPTGLQITDHGAQSVDVAFAACPLQPHATNPTHYRVDVRDDDAKTHVTATTGTGSGDGPIAAHVDLLPAGMVLRVTVSATNEQGVGPASDRLTVILPFATVRDFVVRQRADLAGLLTPSDSVDVAALDAGFVDPLPWLTNLLANGWATKDVEPAARLYQAYFLRQPDKGGLAFWVGQHRKGRTFSSISEEFARSSEFTRRYGSLTERQFVAKLYQNVFGRAADASGLDYWTKRLDQRKDTRGRVVLKFSESSEGKRRFAPLVEPLATAYLMLGRFPTAAERFFWAQIDPGSFHRDVAQQIIATEEYAARVGA